MVFIVILSDIVRFLLFFFEKNCTARLLSFGGHDYVVFVCDVELVIWFVIVVVLKKTTKKKKLDYSMFSIF